MRGFQDIQQLLHIFARADLYRVKRELSAESRRFIDQYKIKDFFIALLQRFDPGKHCTNSEAFFKAKLEQYNQENQTAITQDELINRFFLIQANGRVLVNPYLNLREPIGDPTLNFVREFRNTQYYYPLFDEALFRELLNRHNKQYCLDISLEELIGQAKTPYEAIFHNLNGLKNALEEALNEYIASLSYEQWENNITKYANLLIELGSYKLFYNSSVWMELNKAEVLKRYLMECIRNDRYIKSIENLNYLNRLRYVPYEIQGIDIINPPTGTALIPYSEDQYQERNIFQDINIRKHFYFEFENHSLFSLLFKEFDFCFSCWPGLLSTEDWQTILEQCDSFYYKFVLSWHHLHHRVWQIVEFKSLTMAPFVIHCLMNLSGINSLDEHGLNIDHLKETIVIEYLVQIASPDILFFNLLADLYFRLPVTKGYLFRELPSNQELREEVIRRMIGFIRAQGMPKGFIDRIKNCRNGFHDFDLLIRLGMPEYYGVVIEAYFKLIEDNRFYENYNRFEGKGNLFKVLSDLSRNDLERFLKKFDFSSRFSAFSEEQKSGDPEIFTKIYKEGQKVRFHLGLLCLFCKSDSNVETKQIVSRYILECFRILKKIDIQGYSPLGWDNILFDTFSINWQVFNLDEILTWQIISVLKMESREVVLRFFKDLEKYLSPVEIALFMHSFPDIVGIGDFPIEKYLSFNVDNYGLGRANKEAYLMVLCGYPEFGLRYIEYIETLGKQYITDDIIELKLEILLQLKRYPEAKALLDSFSDKRMNASRMGCIYYHEGNYLEAERCFQNYLAKSEPNRYTIVNYSATLICMDKNDQAIELLEKYKETYFDEPLLYLNLGIAYSRFDQLKSFYYLLMAKRLKPDLNQVDWPILNHAKDLIPGFLNAVMDGYQPLDVEKSEILNGLITMAHSLITKVAPLKIDETEKKIVQEIYNALERRKSNPKRLKETSETELSDDIRDIIATILRKDEIIVARECPFGFAKETVGEIDLFIYREKDTYDILAIGENKEWNGEKAFTKQLKQLFGYIREKRGFGFTIVFCKNRDLKDVIEKRNKVLESFYVEDKGERFFEKQGPFLEAAHYISGINDVYITKHKNPENSDSFVRLYHFILHANPEEREITARQARES